jgi:hypothetical protein
MNNIEDIRTKLIPETIIAYFDIYAYSGFIKSKPIEECIKDVKELFKKAKNICKLKDYSDNISFNHWILSDSIIIAPNKSTTLNRKSISYLLLLSSAFLTIGMRKGLPLRGAVGGGNLYVNDDVIVSSALINANEYIKRQEWWGAIITCEAQSIIVKHDPDFRADYSTDSNYQKNVSRGNIAWKEEDKSSTPDELFYLKPLEAVPDFADNLPCYIRDPNRSTFIKNSQLLYGGTAREGN